MLHFRHNWLADIITELRSVTNPDGSWSILLPKLRVLSIGTSYFRIEGRDVEDQLDDLVDMLEERPKHINGASDGMLLMFFVCVPGNETCKGRRRGRCLDFNEGLQQRLRRLMPKLNLLVNGEEVSWLH